jgi:mannose-6-phosphate isomerase-like protein (cupin superfamily)
MIVKPWGTSLKLYDTDGYALFHMKLKKGGYSSTHMHSKSYNKFILVKGAVKLNVLPIIDSNHVVEYDLTLWKPIVVNPTVYHKFIAVSDSILYEIYISDETYDENDITRLDTNGIKDTL